MSQANGKVFQSDSRRPRWVRSAACAAALALALMAMLPFTQALRDLEPPDRTVRSIDLSIPPPPPPEPDFEPPPPPPQDDPPPQLDAPPQQLSLSQLEQALNPTAGSAMAGAFSLEGFATQPDAIADLNIFEISDLDEEPRLIRRGPVVYPPSLRQQRIEGSARIQIIIDERGMVEIDQVISATHPEFADAAMDALRQSQYETPRKDGQAVRARYQLNVPFRLAR